jgi:hypothetical protein
MAGWEVSIGTVVSEEDYLDLMWASANSAIMKDLEVNGAEEPEEPDTEPVRFEEKDAEMRESNHG